MHLSSVCFALFLREQVLPFSLQRPAPPPPGVSTDPAHSGFTLGIGHSKEMRIIRKQLSKSFCRAMLKERGRSSKMSSIASPRVISVFGFVQIIYPVLVGLAEVTGDPQINKTINKS